MSLIQLANAASRYLRSGKLKGVMSLIQLAVLTRPANDAGASALTRSDNDAAHLADAQSEREATAAQSGKTKGNAASRYLRSGKLKGVRSISAWLHRIISSHLLINV
jgi:hypothetical protein